mgnify:CR=1 FL=1
MLKFINKYFISIIFILIAITHFVFMNYTYAIFFSLLAIGKALYDNGEKPYFKILSIILIITGAISLHTLTFF